MVFWLAPAYFRVFMFAMTLQKENWWHSKNEPFFTNCSGFNAFVCWWMWICLEMVYYTLCLYALILVCGIVAGTVSIIK
jgi:hypothetical protein